MDGSYRLTDADVGHTIRIHETASNAGGPEFACDADPTAVVLPLPPANSAPPSITGFAQQGKTLSETHGTWSNSPAEYAYQLAAMRFRGRELPGDLGERLEPHADGR